MKRKLIAGLLIGMLAITPLTVYADDADLEARITALEERVAALEAQLGINASSNEAETEGNSEYTLSAAGYTLTYKDCEIGKDMWENDSVILHFDFTNDSGDTGAAGDAFLLKAYQNGTEIKFTSVMDSEWYTELRSGGNTLEVTFPFKIGDTSDVIVSMKSLIDYSLEPIEFTVSLQ